MVTEETQAPAVAENVTGARIVAALIDIVLLAVVFVIMALLFGESNSEDGGFEVNLSGGTVSVDIHRNGEVIAANISNAASYTDNLGRSPAPDTYTYKVCNAGTEAWSNEASVTIG
jgi:hypothetical protein